MSLLRSDGGSAQDKTPSNAVYEIVMVAVAAAIMLVCGLIFIILVLKRRWTLGEISYDNYIEEGTVSSISLNRASNDNISTADLHGPVYVSYINDKGALPTEIPIGKVKLSRDALLYISLMTCMNLPDDMDSEENL